VVFRRDSKVDAFQRQISALRHQLGGENEGEAAQDRDRPHPIGEGSSYLSEYPEFTSIASDRISSAHRTAETMESSLSGPVPTPIPAIDLQTSVIAHSTAWSGDVESSGSLHVHGRVEGSLTARDSIFIAEEADVEAVIRAANVTVAGNVQGSIYCAERFEVLAHGKVAGDVHSPVITVHDGAVIAGDISMTPSTSARSSTTPPLRVARGGD
jgi:cytoskeletal protein CcmA (bactofilin family)